MLHVSFTEIGLLILEKTFECFLSIYRRGDHLGHATHMPQTNFRFYYAGRLHTNFALRAWFQRKASFNFDMKRTLR